MLIEAGACFVGFADMRNIQLPHNNNLTTAISIGIVYPKSIIDQLDILPDEFYNHLSLTKKSMKVILEKCDIFLKNKGYQTWVPPISKDLPNLKSIFSHKMAATMAGLGWIGKNCLFISNEFGCGSRLATVLTDAPLSTGQPIKESKCGSCNKCIKVCPCNAIKGTLWHAGTAREELLNPWVCNKYRDSFKEKIGHAHPCGLCIKACAVQ